MSSFEFSETLRKLANIVRPGTIKELDTAKGLVRVQSGGLLTGWLPFQTFRAGADQTWWPVEVGEQVVIISPDGDTAQGYVLGSFYSDNGQQPETNADKPSIKFKDGGVISYDRQAHHFDINLPAGATVSITSDGGLTFTGDLTVNGNIKATGDIEDKTRSMAEDRTIYNSHDHTGNMDVPTSPPLTSQ